MYTAKEWLEAELQVLKFSTVANEKVVEMLNERVKEAAEAKKLAAAATANGSKQFARPRRPQDL